MEKKKKIMVVDDDQDLRSNLQYQFAARDYEVVTANDGLDGLEKLNNFSPDLMILDLNMPNMGGIELYHKISEETGSPKHPVLILTARANTKELFENFNIDGFITKPFEIDDVIKEAGIIIEKKSNTGVSKEKLKALEARGIFFVDNDQESFNKVGLTFLNSGYKVNSAQTGARAIEKMMMDPPALALVNLSLEDISGDIVIEKLLRMPKTEDIKFILYVHRNGDHDPHILEKMGEKKSILGCVEYVNPDELLDAVNKAFA